MKKALTVVPLKESSFPNDGGKEGLTSSQEKMVTKD